MAAAMDQELVRLHAAILEKERQIGTGIDLKTRRSIEKKVGTTNNKATETYPGIKGGRVRVIGIENVDESGIIKGGTEETDGRLTRLASPPMLVDPHTTRSRASTPTEVQIILIERPIHPLQRDQEH